MNTQLGFLYPFTKKCVSIMVDWRQVRGPRVRDEDLGCIDTLIDTGRGGGRLIGQVDIGKQGMVLSCSVLLAPKQLLLGRSISLIYV